ncbi:MAG TPA: hypothetical protein VII96_13695 [Acidimicrobiales bacterium]
MPTDDPDGTTAADAEPIEPGEWEFQIAGVPVVDPRIILKALQEDSKTAAAVSNVSGVAVAEILTPVAGLESAQTVSPEELDRASDREERKSLIQLRKMFAKFFLWILAGQLVFMNVVLILSGTNAITIPASVMQFYLAGTFGEIVGLVTIAVTFLFSDKPPLGIHGK